MIVIFWIGFQPTGSVFKNMLFQINYLLIIANNNDNFEQVLVYLSFLNSGPVRYKLDFVMAAIGFHSLVFQDYSLQVLVAIFLILRSLTFDIVH